MALDTDVTSSTPLPEPNLGNKKRSKLWFIRLILAEPLASALRSLGIPIARQAPDLCPQCKTDVETLSVADTSDLALNAFIYEKENC